MASRLMAKTFDVEVGEKGSPLQTKFNAFTKGKNIVDVHSFSINANGASIQAVLLYSLGAEDAENAPRLYVKVLDNVPVGSEIQTKINSFSKGKDLDVKATAVASNGEQATVGVVYARNDE